MASLDAATLTVVDVELPVNGLARDLDLVLLSDVGLVERGAAIGTDLGQWWLVDLVDLFGGRWLAVGLGAIVLARLPSGLLGVRLGLALGKGFCLALAGTQGRVELTTEPLV